MAMMKSAQSAIHQALHVEQAQRDTLRGLIARGRDTVWGREHALDKVKSYEDYASAIPVVGYEPLRPYVMRMIAGEKDVLWPGACRRFAQSSGTSGGKSKYIPVTPEGLKQNHFAGAARSVALYLRQYPDSRMFSGKGFILGGSYANEVHPASGAMIGDLSANLIDAAPWPVQMMRVPRKEVALMEEWEKKLPALVEASMRCDITNISGVPSWFLTVLRGVLAGAGANNIGDVWPNLEVFFHGGISFGPYRDEYAAIMPAGMRYWENYNASEGFFACTSGEGDGSMLLLADVGVFYELVPIGEEDNPFPPAVPLWQAEAGATYSLVITSCNGLWRYAIGDTVRVESLDPVKITIAGRTKSYINAFGEEVMVHNTDAALEKVCRSMHCSALNYHAAPVYTHGQSKGRHQWIVEWGVPPASVQAFADALDAALQQENSDYQAKRHGGIFLDRLEIITASPGLFDRWLAATGKLGGQRKVPRLSNDRKIIDRLIALNGNAAFPSSRQTT